MKTAKALVGQAPACEAASVLQKQPVHSAADAVLDFQQIPLESEVAVDELPHTIYHRLWMNDGAAAQEARQLILCYFWRQSHWPLLEPVPRCVLLANDVRKVLRPRLLAEVHVLAVGSVMAAAWWDILAAHVLVADLLVKKVRAPLEAGVTETAGALAPALAFNPQAADVEGLHAVPLHFRWHRRPHHWRPPGRREVSCQWGRSRSSWRGVFCSGPDHRFWGRFWRR